MTDLVSCDFCNERTDEPTMFDTWTACGVCSRMIKLKRWQALLDYAVSSVYINSPKLAASLPESEVRAAVKAQHDEFRKRVVTDYPWK